MPVLKKSRGRAPARIYQLLQWGQVSNLGWPIRALVHQALSGDIDEFSCPQLDAPTRIGSIQTLAQREVEEVAGTPISPSSA
jgi:hypothetical protein